VSISVCVTLNGLWRMLYWKYWRGVNFKDIPIDVPGGFNIASVVPTACDNKSDIEHSHVPDDTNPIGSISSTNILALNSNHNQINYVSERNNDAIIVCAKSKSDAIIYIITIPFQND